MILGEAQSLDSPYKLEVLQGIICAWWQGANGEMENYLMLPPGYTGNLNSALKSLMPHIQSNASASVLRYLQTEERPEWRQSLSHHGLIQADSAPLMAANLQDDLVFLRVNDQVRVARVEAACEYQEACALAQRIFGGPLSVTRFFAQPGWTSIYAAWLGDDLVGAATLWPFGGAAGVYSVVTQPEFRRQGIAAAVMNRLLADARQSGFSTATLRTTDALIPVYAPGGFLKVGRVVRWVRLGGTGR